MLPLEAIELDGFRRQHELDTFWCGLLLGGCGAQLTTKLYTDRVCHFAHHPGTDGVPHVCGRRSRGVSSADHLYVKSAAAAWLRASADRADIGFGRDYGAPLGSVVDIASRSHRLRVHLDHEVEPVWDEDGVEPVLGLSVPVERDTLIKRWYVHRIRLDSEGTSRRVRIGTEAFARSTEWFGLEECTITGRGLSTPAVERIVQARSAPPPSLWVPGQEVQLSEQDSQAQELLRRLLYARRTESAVLAEAACGAGEELSGLSEAIQRQLDAAIRSARLWLGKEAQARRELFERLDQAVADCKTRRTKELLKEVWEVTDQKRTEDEARTIDRAADYLAGAKADATSRLDTLLDELGRLPDDYDPDRLRPLVRRLFQEAAQAGNIGPHRKAQIKKWKARSRAQSGPSAGTPRYPQLHQQVSRRRWNDRKCPRCQARSGQKCVVDGDPARQERSVPHDERLQRIIDERKERVRNSQWRVYEVTCPDCHQGAEARCTTSGGPHRSRVELAKEFSRTHKPRPKPESTG